MPPMKYMHNVFCVGLADHIKNLKILVTKETPVENKDVGTHSLTIIMEVLYF